MKATQIIYHSNGTKVKNDLEMTPCQDLPMYEYNPDLPSSQNKKYKKMYDMMRQVGLVALGRRARHA